MYCYFAIVLYCIVWGIPRGLLDGVGVGLEVALGVVAADGHEAPVVAEADGELPLLGLLGREHVVHDVREPGRGCL